MAARHIRNRASFFDSQCRTGTCRLTDHGTGCHDAGRAHGHVGSTNITARKHQIGYILGIQAAERNLIRHLGGNMVGGIAHEFEALWIVVIHGPATESNGIREFTAFFQILLR